MNLLEEIRCKETLRRVSQIRHAGYLLRHYQGFAGFIFISRTPAGKQIYGAPSYDKQTALINCIRRAEEHLQNKKTKRLPLSAPPQIPAMPERK